MHASAVLWLQRQTCASVASTNANCNNAGRTYMVAPVWSLHERMTVQQPQHPSSHPSLGTVMAPKRRNSGCTWRGGGDSWRLTAAQVGPEPCIQRRVGDATKITVLSLLSSPMLTGVRAYLWHDLRVLARVRPRVLRFRVDAYFTFDFDNLLHRRRRSRKRSASLAFVRRDAMRCD